MTCDRYIEEEYIPAYRNEKIGIYYVFDDGMVSYEAYRHIPDHIRDELKQDGLSENIGRNIRQKGHIPFFDDLMKETNRVQGRKRVIYESGPVRMSLHPLFYHLLEIFEGFYFIIRIILLSHDLSLKRLYQDCAYDSGIIQKCRRYYIIMSSEEVLCFY